MLVVVLHHVSKMFGLSDSSPLSTSVETLLHHPKYAIGHDYSIHMDYKLPEYRTNLLLMMFFQNTFIIKKVTMPAVTEQRLKTFSVSGLTDISCF